MWRILQKQLPKILSCADRVTGMEDNNNNLEVNEKSMRVEKRLLINSLRRREVKANLKTNGIDVIKWMATAEGIGD